MQGKEKCYNKIYCCFNEDGKDTIEILKEAFIDYLKNTENKAKTLEKNINESEHQKQQVVAEFRR